MEGRRYGKSVNLFRAKEPTEHFFNFNSEFLDNTGLQTAASLISEIGSSEVENDLSDIAPAVFIIKEYYHLYLASDLLESLDKRTLNPAFIKQLKCFWTNKVAENKDLTNLNLQIYLYKMDTRNPRTEEVVITRIHEYCFQKSNQFKWLIFWDVIYAVLLLIFSYTLMVYGGFLAIYYAPDNTTINLFSTFCLQTTMWWFNWQAFDKLFYMIRDKYHEYCFFEAIYKSHITFKTPPSPININNSDMQNL